MASAAHVAATVEGDFVPDELFVSMASAAHVAATKARALDLALMVVSMASAAHVAATYLCNGNVHLGDGLNGLCGPCRCDSGGSFPIAKSGTPTIQTFPTPACGIS